MVFHPRYALRMLEASVAAGIEAPPRLYLSEQVDGTARLTYRLPSQVFGACEVDALDDLGRELDDILPEPLPTSDSKPGEICPWPTRALKSLRARGPGSVELSPRRIVWRR